MARPLVQKGIAELEELANGAERDPGTIREVIAELRHRSSPRAKRLLAELEGGNGNERPDRAKRKPTKGRTPPRGAAPGPEAPEPVSVAHATSSRTLEKAFALLRETFTEDSEILAKWGMTTSMPRDLRDLVFEHWSWRVGSKSDEFGRNAERLHADLDRLRNNEDNKERLE